MNDDERPADSQRPRALDERRYSDPASMDDPVLAVSTRAGPATDSGSDSATAAALLATARRLFALHGYEGTSVRVITGGAGANLGAITYHFGSKRELYDRVVESLVVPLAERVERIAAGDGTAVERAVAVVAMYFEYLSENPDLPPLMTQELALSGVPPQVVAAPMARVLGALTRLVREGQEAGEVRSGPAELMGIFILSVPVHLGILRPALHAQWGLDLLDRGTRPMVTSCATDWVTSALSTTREES
jgi:AcrR family transcriptional regulator